MVLVPPPSEPDRRISRIRLSGRWFSLQEDGPSEPERRGETAPARQGHHDGLAPPAGVANMSSRSIAGLRPVGLATRVPGGTAPGYSHRCRLRRSPCSSSTFLRSLRSMAVTPLLRYYGRSDSCPPISWTLRFSVCSTWGQVSLIHAPGLPAIPSPNTCGLRLLWSGHLTPSPGRTENASLRELGASPFPWLARPTSPAESSSVSSPPGETSYGLAVHLPLLPTMPHGTTSHCSEIAVTFGYRLR